MVESSQIGDARRQAAKLASGLDFDELASGRVALVVTELATNLVRHAKQGLLLIGVYAQASVPTIEVISIDSGPGMGNIGKSMTDGVSTAGTSGNGLGAVQRTSSQLMVFSKIGFGSVVVARLTADNSALPERRDTTRVSHAGLCVAAPGEVVSGDAWACAEGDRHVALLVADGLGHGPGAAEAADTAVDLFRARPEDSPRDIAERCHAALRSTRGAALAAIDVDLQERIVSFCGAGNITARIMNGTEDRSLLSQHGTVGLQVRRFQEIQYKLPEHAILVAHSDGIVTRWDLSEVQELLAADPIMLAAHLIKTKSRGKDDATVVVVHCN